MCLSVVYLREEWEVCTGAALCRSTGLLPPPYFAYVMWRGQVGITKSIACRVLASGDPELQGV